MKRVLITGASSGIGAAFARHFSSLGYETILVARRKERLEDLKNELSSPSEVVAMDLLDMEQAALLVKNYPDIDILINNAGFGVYGEFTETDFQRESDMIDLNIRTLHFLMKEYITLFEKRGSGKILNVASSAAFFSGPLLSSYYASKAYVLRLSLAVREELRRKKSPVTISVLCPGPVKTEFGKVSGSDLGKASLSPDYVAKVSAKALFSGKAVIVPGVVMKAAVFFSKFLPSELSVRLLYKVQSKKRL